VLVLVADGRVAPFDGDLDDYRAWLDARRRPAEAGGPAEPDQPVLSRKEQRRQEAETRQRLAAQRRPLEKRLREVEQELGQLAHEKQRLETLAADPQLYDPGNRDQLKAALLEQSRVTARLQELETLWLGLQEQLEGLATQ
jgi:ATP-binding cassette subfamily F protein 3